MTTDTGTLAIRNGVAKSMMHNLLATKDKESWDIHSLARKQAFYVTESYNTEKRKNSQRIVSFQQHNTDPICLTLNQPFIIFIETQTALIKLLIATTYDTLQQ